MSGVETVQVSADDDGIRLDRWFKRHYPALKHGQLEKLLRKGQIRVDGGRIKANHRLAEGQMVRVPPLAGVTSEQTPKPKNRDITLSDAEMQELQARVLYRDDHVIAFNKPPGLAVQGGSKTTHHLDGMLDALRFGSEERPRLVHRLDKDTSGVMLLARSPSAAAKLTASFRGSDARKLYWAAVVGVPRPAQGRINMALGKVPGRVGERVMAGVDGGKKAVTLYRIVERAGTRAAWLAMEPLTGRTHQLRVHSLLLETPILGDGKYGGAEAFLDGEGIARQLHLHARAIRLPHPAKKGFLEVTAPLPGHMMDTWQFLGFSVNEEATGGDPFAEFDT